MNKKVKNKGLALPIALLVIVVLSLLAVSSMKQSGFVELVAGNVQDKKLSFQAAEAVLRDVEKSLNINNFNNTENGYYDYGNVNFDEVNWNDGSQVKKFTGFSNMDFPLNRMKSSYIVERMPFVQRYGESLATDRPRAVVQVYRVTVHTQGISRNSSVIIQGTYKKQE